ncbi:MAG: hypothetical protein AAF713_04660 [Pseudomonadota bacterium]
MAPRFLIAAAVSLAASTGMAAQGERVQITGEMIDTWCYFSGVMGGPDAVVGSAHHTCAMWCAAGGIPVGVLTEDGTVYMVVKWEGDAAIADGTAMLDVQAHVVTADGLLYERDGIKYIMVDSVVDDTGIQNLSHEEYGVNPGFTIPDPNK